MKFKYKKLILFMLPSLVVLGVYFVYSDNGKTEKIYEKDKTLTSAALGDSQTQDIRKDSDNDGLMDWEEALWKTDPNNPDTDGNGVLDGEQVRNEGLQAYQGKTLADYMDPDADTLTNTLNKKILYEMVIQKGINGDPLTQEGAKKIAESFFDTINSSIQPPLSQYSMTDIVILNDYQKDDIKKYANHLGTIIKKHFDSIPEGEMSLFQKGVLNKDPDSLKKLKPLELAYKNTAIEALKIEVPNELAQNHLSILNSFHQISNQINDMQKAFMDPAMALMAFKFYRDSSKTAFFALNSTNSLLQNKEIVFEDTEPGKLFEMYI